MTVKELIQELSNFNQDLTVYQTEEDVWGTIEVEAVIRMFSLAKNKEIILIK